MKLPKIVALTLTSSLIVSISMAAPSAASPKLLTCTDSSASRVAAELLEESSVPTQDGSACALEGKQVRLKSGQKVTIPKAGTGYSMHAVVKEGYPEVPEITVQMSASGDLAIVEHLSNGTSRSIGNQSLAKQLVADQIQETSALVSTKCSYNSVNINPRNWNTTTYGFWLTNSPSWPAPAGAFTDLVEWNLTPAAAVWPNRTNACGLNYPVNRLTTKYNGRTTGNANVNPDGSCNFVTDARSTLTFKDITSPGVLAWACTWHDLGNKLTEADIIFDTTGTNWAWYDNGSLYCPSGSGLYTFQGIATHEIGHAVGLSHAGAGQESGQVMRPQFSPCSTTDAQLGAGDLASLHAHYHY